jgi:hypothetical protein
MMKEELSTKKKIDQLKKELAQFHNDQRYLKYDNMASILKLHLVSLRKHLK